MLASERYQDFRLAWFSIHYAIQLACGVAGVLRNSVFLFATIRGMYRMATFVSGSHSRFRWLHAFDIQYTVHYIVVFIHITEAPLHSHRVIRGQRNVYLHPLESFGWLKWRYLTSIVTLKWTRVHDMNITVFRTTVSYGATFKSALVLLKALPWWLVCHACWDRSNWLTQALCMFTNQRSVVFIKEINQINQISILEWRICLRLY